MEVGTELTATPEAKYQKLASEYSKLRARAGVLRKAVLDEQSKGESLREQLRQSESALRRSEQEVDSLGFRNRQLEHRVSVLQDEIATREGRKKFESDFGRKRMFKKNDADVNLKEGDLGQDALIFEELQKKIMENAELTTLIDDKERELQIHTEHVDELQQILEKRITEFTEVEKRLRRDIEILHKRNSDLETKLIDAVSMLGSEDALSVSGSDHTPLHAAALQNNHQTPMHSTSATSEDRISCLEKEMVHWRTQYEILKINESLGLKVEAHPLNKNDARTSNSAVFETAVADFTNCSCSSTAAGLTVEPCSKEGKNARESFKELTVAPTKEQLIYNKFSQKFEDLLKAKYLADSRITSYETEVEHFQICLSNATHELKTKDEQIGSINQALKMLEEDLATTRLNYEEQISVLTEQVINLSEQLAASK